MSTILELVNSTPVHGGLSDGYRRSQLGQPAGTVGQPPRFRGESNKPGSDVKAPRILSSAARNNRATNVTIPYARVVPADELCNKGRLSPGDVAFVSRYQYGRTQQLKMNHKQAAQVVTSASTAHASVSRIAGLDYVNRALGLTNYYEGSTVLVDSANPLDEWRSLTFLNEWTVDGIVMSNDSPGYVMGASGDSRNDQVFNMGIQGPVQLNNGYEDDAGRGIAAHYDRQRQMAAGNMVLEQPDGMTRAEYIRQAQGANALISNLIAGPFYQQYPLQMFDRKIRPLSDLYIGLICRKIEGTELDAVNTATGKRFAAATHIHVFQYVCFSSRQVYQYATTDDDPYGNSPDFDIVDTGRAARGDTVIRRNGDDYNLGESEPADRRRGPNDPKRGRTSGYLPRKRASDYDDTFLGIKKKELANMVGAWRIGKVLDVASKRMEGYSGGPIDTAFNVTLNFDLSFLDWRQLRRNFTSNIFGYDLDLEDGLGNKMHWIDYNARKERFVNDLGRVLQWPTWYDLDPKKADDNIPINPTMKALDFYGYDKEMAWKDVTGMKHRDAFPHILGLGQTPDEQRLGYNETVEQNKYQYPTLFSNETIGQSASAAPEVQRARVDPVSSSPPVATDPPVAAPVVAAEAPAPPRAEAGPLSFPEQVEQSSASSKATGKSKASVEKPVEKPVDPTPPPAPAAPKAVSNPATKPASLITAKPTGSIGDDVMAKIFGSSMPSEAGTDASASGASGPQRAESEGRSDEQPRSFPRRRDR